MKIAIFTEYYYPFISGVVTHIESLKDELEKKGHEVLIVTTDPHSKTHYIKDGVLYCPAKGVKKIYGYGVTIPYSHHRLKYLRDFNPDLIHIQTEFTVGIFGLWAAKKLNKPVVYTLHTLYDQYTFYVVPEMFNFIAKPIVHKYLGVIAKHADEITSPSPKGRVLLEKGGIHKPVTIIPNATDLHLFLPENVNRDKVRQIRRKYGFKDGDVVLCFCGRLGKEKSIDVLIEYFAKSSEKCDKYKLLIMGDGPENESLKQLARDTGFADRIFFTGKVDHEEISAYYYACDLYATASVTEANSISALEAGASGLLMLQKLDEGNKYQITQGENGYTFKDFEEFDLRLRDYTALSIDERKQVRDRVMASSRKYGPEEFVNNILKVYNRAICDRQQENAAEL